MTTNPTAYGTYGVYGYNGEYTHTNLGLQYLRARYLNVATGTFTSRDTYAGRMQDILSQNRYTYAENNPVGHSDPSGHAVMGSLITTAFRNATTSRADKARAATQAAVAAYANEQSKRTVLEQRNEAWIKSQEEALANRPVGLATYVAQQIASYPGAYTPWAQSISAYAEQKVCQAYNYCKNEFQEAIKGKDVTRIANGVSLIEGSVMKMLGENALVQGGASVLLSSNVGAVIGAFGIVAGIYLGSSAIVDIKQGINEIKLGWQGDYETSNPNILVETAYGGDENAYHTSTLVASFISVVGIPVAGTLDEKNALNQKVITENGSSSFKVNYGGGESPIYRGGNDFTVKSNEVKINPQTGNVKTSHGVSLDVNPETVSKFGGVYRIETLPEGLNIIQRGARAEHFEIVPAYEMPLEQFQELLNQITFTGPY